MSRLAVPLSIAGVLMAFVGMYFSWRYGRLEFTVLSLVAILASLLVTPKKRPPETEGP